MWYMLLEPKLKVYPNLLSRTPASGYVAVPSRPASRRVIGSLLDRVRETFDDARLRRRAMEELTDLDDRLLRDIGLERGRIPEVVDAMLRPDAVESGGVGPRGREPKRAGESFFVRAGKHLLKGWVRRRAINEFARLDDRLLRDIGLERDRIPEVVDAMIERKPLPLRSATVHYLVAGDSKGPARDELPTRAAA